MAQLGCEITSVTVQRRGGGPMPSQPQATTRSARNWSSVEWNRLLDDSSGAQVRIEGKALCCDWASKVEPWRDEIRVDRGSEPVWCGPVTDVNWVGDELRIDAKDLSYWLNRRSIHQFHSYGVGTDLAVIFNDIVGDALSVDATPNFAVRATATGVFVDEEGGRSYVPYQAYASDVINELSRTGIDWTCINRSMLVGGVVVPLPYDRLIRLTAKHFQQAPDVQKDGYAFGSRFYVSGAGGGDAGASVFGTNAIDYGIEATYGVVERLVNEPLIRDNGTAGRNANTRFDLLGKTGAPIFVKGGRLTEVAPITISDLVPGAVFAIGLGDCPPVNVQMRLTSVSGSVGPEHDWVAVNFEPVGGDVDNQ